MSNKTNLKIDDRVHRRLLRRAKQKLNLPRAPLLKQTGGAHKLKNKVVVRGRKHKQPAGTWDNGK